MCHRFKYQCVTIAQASMQFGYFHARNINKLGAVGKHGSKMFYNKIVKKVLNYQPLIPT